MKIIDVPFDVLDEIYHVADVHIRLFKRHDEYRAVFRRVYDQFKQDTSKNRVIVVAGDIVHAKTDMSPEMLELASEFLKSLADIAPTLIIAGNHDLNLSNMNRLDSLTPIVKSLNHKNLTYLKHSGVYQVADADFAVFSILDEQSEWPTSTDVRPTAKKIALFHGPVNGAQTDTNYVITNRHVDVSSFDGFDVALLGDIHKYQIMQRKTSSKPEVVYASSLIQQSHGETVSGHGWCKWDLQNFTHTFVPVKNDYGYYTLEISSENVDIPTDMPTNVRLRLMVNGVDSAGVKKITAMIRKQYNIIELSVNKVNSETKTADTQQPSTALDVTNVTTQNTLIQDWIERTHDSVDDVLMKKIIDLNTTINSTIAYDDQSRNVHWRPVKFTFSNMFSYGDKNEINFDKLSGIYGIFAPNATGKSSSIDALMFCLYDKTPRAFRGDHIMNNRRDSFECELQLEINEESYFIRRTGTKKKSGEVKVDVSFWKEEPDGTQISLNAEDRRATNAVIRNYVGTYEDFVLTTLSSQNGSALFIDKSHSERKDLLIQFMGLNIFDVLHDAAKEEMKEVSAVLKKFSKTDFTQELADTQTVLETALAKLAKIEETTTKYKEERELLDKQLRELQSQKTPVPNIKLDREQLNISLQKVITDIETYHTCKQELEDRVRTINTHIAEKTKLVVDANISELRRSVELYNNWSAALAKTNSSLKLTLSKIEEKEKFRIKLDGYKYNKDCVVCVENNKSIIADKEEVNDILVELDRIRFQQEDSIEEIKKEMESLVGKVNECVHYENLQTEIHQLQKKAASGELEIQKLITNIERGERQKEQLQNDIQLFITNEDNIKHNKEIDERINHVEYDIGVNKKALEKMEKELRELHGEIKVRQSVKADIIRQIKEAEELEDTYEAYKYYMSAVGRDGVPHEIMSQAIPNIQNEINSILTQIADFTINLEVDGKNILGRLNYDHERIWPLENSSGMERFISSLAIRVALLTASNLPKPNFLIIDEGLGALDVENLGAMSTLFGILKTQFDFIIVISHLDAVRDMVDKVLDIKREDGFSYINV